MIARNQLRLNCCMDNIIIYTNVHLEIHVDQYFIVYNIILLCLYLLLYEYAWNSIIHVHIIIR